MQTNAKEAKQKRYDRQLRLWGEHGQQAMEECSACLLNASACGSETLKNLVLPGIGAFTIVDGSTVSEADLGNNFFLDANCLGQSRAASVTMLLQELNEHVAGAYVAEDISQVLDSRPEFLNAFNLVIATQLPTKELTKVAEICAARKIPLIVAHAYGFMGYIRLMLNEHQVVESHPDHAFPDLRVCAPPPALVDFVRQRYSDLSILSTADYAHIPYVVLLLKAVEMWAGANGGALPSTYKQKKEVGAIIDQFRRADVQSDLNLEEAKAAINTTLNLPKPSSSVGAILKEARARVSQLAAEMHASSVSADEDGGASPAVRRQQLGFWLMAAAVGAFVEAEGQGMLPVLGTIPDMTAHTETYVALQTIYHEQSQLDLGAVQAHVQQIVAIESLPADLVTVEMLKRFCKNAHNLQVLQYRTLGEELAPETARSSALSGALDDEASSGALYVMLRAAQAFYAGQGRWPGQHDSEVDSDASMLKQCATDVTKELNLSSTPMLEDLVSEFCRWGGGELHTIASVMGGIASQEAIKAVTHQYLPLNNTFVFNGQNGTTSALEL